MENNQASAPTIESRPTSARRQLGLIAMTAVATLLVAYLVSQFLVPAPEGVRGPQLAPQGPTQPVAPERGYEYSRDWFTSHIPIWEKALAPFRGKPGINYLEIGVFEGRSCAWMLENILTEPTARLTAMDVFLEMPKNRFLANMQRTGAADKVTLIVGPSQKELRKLPLESFDIIYIDGSHSADDVLEDAVLSWRLLKEGGLLIFDDYAWVMPYEEAGKPKLAIDIFHKLYGKHFTVIHCDYQVILRKQTVAPERRTW